MDKNCALCVRRARHIGGNGTCPVFDKRDCSAEANWDIHVGLWPRGCSNFKAGDRRIRKLPMLPQDSLF